MTILVHKKKLPTQLICYIDSTRHGPGSMYKTMDSCLEIFAAYRLLSLPLPYVYVVVRSDNDVYVGQIYTNDETPLPLYEILPAFTKEDTEREFQQGTKYLQAHQISKIQCFLKIYRGIKELFAEPEYNFYKPSLIVSAFGIPYSTFECLAYDGFVILPNALKKVDIKPYCQKLLIRDWYPNSKVVFITANGKNSYYAQQGMPIIKCTKIFTGNITIHKQKKGDNEVTITTSNDIKFSTTTVSFKKFTTIPLRHPCKPDDKSLLSSYFLHDTLPFAQKPNNILPSWINISPISYHYSDNIGGTFTSKNYKPHIKIGKDRFFIHHVISLLHYGYAESLYENIGKQRFNDVKHIYFSNPHMWKKSYPLSTILLIMLICEQATAAILVRVCIPSTANDPFCNKLSKFINALKNAGFTNIAARLSSPIDTTTLCLQQHLQPGVLVVTEGLGTIEACLTTGALAVVKTSHYPKDGVTLGGYVLKDLFKKIYNIHKLEMLLNECCNPMLIPAAFSSRLCITLLKTNILSDAKAALAYYARETLKIRAKIGVLQPSNQFFNALRTAQVEILTRIQLPVFCKFERFIKKHITQQLLEKKPSTSKNDTKPKPKLH